MTFRSYTRHLSAADKRAKDTIKACIATGAEIEYLPEAPRFRYTPVDRRGVDSFRPHVEGSWQECNLDCPPSGRGSLACGRSKPKHTKNWTPSKLDLNPMYTVPMKGDPAELTKARAAWAGKKAGYYGRREPGDPNPLRAYLAKLAAAKREEASHRIQQYKRDRDAL